MFISPPKKILFSELFVLLFIVILEKQPVKKGENKHNSTLFYLVQDIKKKKKDFFNVSICLSNFILSVDFFLITSP